MDHNALLTQLGYNIDDATLAQVKRIFNNADGLSTQDIITLNDHLKPHRCFVAMSGSEDYFKVKNVAQAQGIKEEVENIIQNWASKNKISLKKVNETTHYILGRAK